MFELYVRRAGECRTINEFNRMHIDLEDELGPGEFSTLATKILARAETMPLPCVHWVRTLSELMARSGLPPRATDRVILSPGVALHRSIGDSTQRADRTLVLCFTDISKRMMMPLPLYLQYCPWRNRDYAVLTDHRRSQFFEGVEGLADDFPGLIEALERMLDLRSYRRAMAVGVSSGGLPAVWMAATLGLARGVSIGGATPESLAERPATASVDLTPLFRALGNDRGRSSEYWYFYGEKYDIDRANSERIARLAAVRRFAIQGVMRHNMLYDVFMSGGLKSLLGRIHNLD